MDFTGNKKSICMVFLIFALANILGFKPNELGECDLTTFSQIKALQKTNQSDKEDKILELGYSFEKETEINGDKIRYYVKCLKSFGYNERMSINVSHNTIGYGTHSKTNYSAIKNLVKSSKGCSRRSEGDFDVFENCSDGLSYDFAVTSLNGRGYYFLGVR